jgi:hypothetical protein
MPRRNRPFSAATADTILNHHTPSRSRLLRLGCVCHFANAAAVCGSTAGAAASSVLMSSTLAGE